MPICIHCQKEFEIVDYKHGGKRRYCYLRKCILAEKERRKKMNKAWYLREQAKGRFKKKQQDDKKLKAKMVEKKCLRCRKIYEGILGKGDSSKFGICPHCKTLQAYSFNEDDFGVGIPGVEG